MNGAKYMSTTTTTTTTTTTSRTLGEYTLSLIGATPEPNTNSISVTLSLVPTPQSPIDPSASPLSGTDYSFDPAAQNRIGPALSIYSLHGLSISNQAADILISQGVPTEGYSINIVSLLFLLRNLASHFQSPNYSSRSLIEISLAQAQRDNMSFQRVVLNNL